MTSKQNYLKLMEIDIWRRRQTVDSVVCSASSLDIEKKDLWSDLEQQACGCKKCDLYKTRKNIVFGVGNKAARLLVIGEAPGATEDQQGKPFVGRAGMLLDSMLAAINLHRDEIYIANILKCRPPNNRDPLPNEVECCTPYLNQQIELIRPKLIVAVGRIAAHFLLKTTTTLGNLRGKIYHYGEQKTPLLVTYHPAYLLRSPREKAKAYVDLLHIQQMLLAGM